MIQVSGNRLVNGSGTTLQLRGVNRAGSEYACVQGWGIFDGPSGSDSVSAMRSWKINAVRVTLNEDCWLGINGVSPDYSGSNYQNAVKNYMSLLHQYGIYVILDLHANAPGGYRAKTFQVMPDADHTPDFWRSLASTFRTDRSAEGKTNREIRRCLKRYIARQLYRDLTTAMTPTANISA